MRQLSHRIIVCVAVAALPLTLAAADERPIPRPYEPGGSVATSSWAPETAYVVRQGETLITVTDHILQQQCGDGGFGWPHNDCSQTFYNITGPIILGVLDAHAHTRDVGHLLGAVNAGVFSFGSEYDNGEARFGTFTPYFLMRLGAASRNTSFATLVAADLFDKLQAGTYGPNDRDTAAWIQEVEAVRTGTWVNLRPWEFHTLIPASRKLGHPGQDLLFEQGVLDGLSTLDNSDPDHVYSDLLGVAGAVRGLAFARRTTFPAVVAPLHTGVNGLDSLESLAAYLASLQNPDGSWYWHSNLASPSEDDKDVQTTAYAAMALLEADLLTATSYTDSYRAARDWLVSLVGPNGGIPSSPGGDENTEVEAEALSAIASVDALLFLDGFEAGALDLWTSHKP